MQRLCSKLRTCSKFPISFTTITPKSSYISPFNRFYNTTTSFQQFPSISSQLKSLLKAPTSSITLPTNGSSISPLGHQYVQMRNFSAKSKEKKWKKLTPATSKVKKIKMKTISAFKGRFRTLNDGTIRRWREGKSHNAHLKSKKSKRRLRKPEIVPAAYAKVMKKMNFCAHY